MSGPDLSLNAAVGLGPDPAGGGRQGWNTEQTNPLALRKPAAAAALGVSDETFDRYVRPHVRAVRLGSVTVYPVAELARVLDRLADREAA